MPDAEAPAPKRGERGLVHVCWFTTDLPSSELDDLERLLDPGERARADRFHFERDRGRYVAARGRLRLLLGRHARRPPDLLEFDTGRYGKPILRPASGTDPIQFSLSRSHGIGVAAIGLEEELGIDVERIRPFDNALAIAERMFTGEELYALRALPGEAQPAAFFSYWTRKEAVVKSLGLGLSYPLDAFGLSPEGLGPERVDVEYEGVAATRWVLPVPPLREGFVAALATAGPPPVLCCRAWPGE